MKLVIVESPTKARTLAKYLPKDFVVEASMGHVRDLPQKGGGLAIDVEHNFKPNYQVIGNKKKVVAKLKKLAKKATEIYLAPDPDREGEAIAYHIQYLLEHARPKVAKEKFKRVTFHEITKSAILEAMKHPGVVDMQMVYSQQARRILDRLVGYSLSPVLWKKVRRGLSAGRVQSVAVRLIVEREAEIDKFKPEEYWEIQVELNKLTVELVKINGKKVEIKTEEQAKQIVSALERARYQVVEVIKKEQKTSPSPPFTTSLLQRAGSNLFGWSAKTTMRLAQQLYERGLITYHRTDSYNLSKEILQAGRDYIEREFGKEYLPAKPRYYKTKSKNAQEAHEAIRPTKVDTLVNEISGGKLGEQHRKLYGLIRNRFLACQMTDAVYERTKIKVKAEDKIESGQYELQVSGKVMKFDGWTKLFKSGDEQHLPLVNESELLQLVKVVPEQKFTKPPSRYTEAGLIKELEKRGIGRPSTYATIITTIQTRAYVEKESKSFRPTAIGIAVTEFLIKHFEQVMAYEFTAKMESDLDEIALAKKDWIEVLSAFWKPFEKKVAEVTEKAERAKVPVESTGEKCPQCGEGEVVIRTGRFGKFYSCSRYPECKYTKQYKEYAEGYVCPDCGGKVVIKKSRKGKFYGCENYPKCKWAIWRLPKQGEPLPKSSEMPKRKYRKS